MAYRQMGKVFINILALQANGNTSEVQQAIFTRAGMNYTLLTLIAKISGG